MDGGMQRSFVMSGAARSQGRGCGHPIQQALAVKVFDRRDSGCVRLRLQIAPVDELSEGLLDGLHRGWAGWPSRFGKHVVGS